MAEASSGIERCVCYLIDKTFNVIMILLYGKTISETRAQRLTRWLTLLVAIGGAIALFFIIKSIFKSSGPSVGYVPK